MANKDKYGLAIASLILGILSLGTLLLICGLPIQPGLGLLPICVLPLPIIGLYLGIAGMNSSRRSMAIAGILICIIGFICIGALVFFEVAAIVVAIVDCLAPTAKCKIF